MRRKHLWNTFGRRAVAFLLAAVLALGVMPALGGTAQASAPWMQPYLDKLVEWGVMRGDVWGNLNPDRYITRAEYVTMINRAFGYDEMGGIPFQDVPTQAWYYEDIAIAYHMGYFQGASDRAAWPNYALTREQAVTLLGRNLLYRNTAGESLGFSDSRIFSEWSRGMIEVAGEMNVVTGYEDGSFRPQNYITRGEMAVMLVRAVGTLVQEPGVQTLGNVAGNLTISTSGVTLRDTVVAGDLYLTGGLGLGDVLLENVTVLGKIVAAGAGESNKGDNSIILRNVTCGEMVVDNLTNQFVTVRAEGDTDIASTSVRTNAYLEDATRTGAGLRYIELDGESGSQLQLAGSIKEVLNITPGSTLTMAQGSADKITIDERATNSSMAIEGNAVVKELNLDVATRVTGTGGISTLNVSAAGCTVEMLPDYITVRPGITASIGGETMDSVAAAESSQDPRLLAGYPATRNVAPTTAVGVFATNKRATVYWAVTALADGSVSAQDLISPPTFTKILRSGNIKVDKSSTEVTANLTGLTPDGAYYLSAVMVDSRGRQSPVKVAAFTTPDNSVPAFSQGYPYMSKITNTSGQVTVMATKSCMLYYALLPNGSTAPTVQDFRTGSISGNMGYGSIEMTKNVADTFTVNSRILRELESYDLYLCLVDADSGQNSGVRKLTFKTVDGTPPIFITEPTLANVALTSVGQTAAINENGTIFWAVVKHGEEYPKPVAGQTVKPELTSDTAKMLVATGIGALKNGKVNATANRDVTITVTGLQGQTAYDFYYVAQDTAGNYSAAVKMVTIHTLDNEPPVITQEFTKTADAGGKEPLPDTDVRIVFSEGIQDRAGSSFIDLYTTANDPTKTDTERRNAQNELVRLLRQDFEFYDAGQYPPAKVTEASGTTKPAGAWIDYEKVKVTMEDGKTIFTFGHDDGAINLNSGGTYYFTISNISDTSNNKNVIKPNPQQLPTFTTVFARINLENRGVSGVPHDKDGKEVRVDMSFQMHPVSAKTVDGSVYYDVFLWSDSIIRYNVYARVITSAAGAVTPTYGTKDDAMLGKATVDAGDGWYFLGSDSLTPTADSYAGKSINRLITGNSATAKFPQLNSMTDGYTYEYAIELTQVGTLTDPATWSQRVNMRVTVPAGAEGNLSNLATMVNERTWNEYVSNGLTNGGVASIGEPSPFQVFKQFTDTQVPQFTGGYPKFVPGDAFVDMELMLSRAGTVYYVLAPVEGIGTSNATCFVPATDKNGNALAFRPATDADPNPPVDGTDLDKCPDLSAPGYLDIFNPSYSNPRIKTGSKVMSGAGYDNVTVNGLEAKTTYFAYFVLRGESQTESDVFCFQFTTQEVTTPIVTLDENSPSVNVKTSTSAEMQWALYATDSLFTMLTEKFDSYVDSTKQTAYEDRKDTLFPASNAASSTKPANYPTVLDALIASVSNGGKSVFDEYANQTAYDEVLARIKGERTDGKPYAGRGGPTDMAPNTAISVNCDNYMTPETRYYFLAAARNSQGSIYGFRAVENVRKVDTTPPVYQNVATSLAAQAAYDADASAPLNYNIQKWQWSQDPGSFLYKGTVTVEFDETPYLLIVDSTGRRTLVELKGGTGENITEHLMLTGTRLKITNVVFSGSFITLTFEGAGNGDQIAFFSDGTISNADSYAHPSGQRLRLRFNSYRTVSSDYIQTATADPGWEASWGS
ncbi:MAG: S-layer homology domain-containing protein [Oscillospiraceae bacterium]|nr:S-layer homology domain-containing protein [Oscillospiraceae bacterium]